MDAHSCVNKYRNTYSMQKFCNVLSVIGPHVLAVKMEETNMEILEIVRDKCNNLNSLKLRLSNQTFQLQKFQNLIELRVAPGTRRMKIIELRNCLASNPDIESLECDRCEEDDILELIKMLPKLKQLSLLYPVGDIFLKRHLFGLEGLTKFSFVSITNCNQILIELAKRLNLVELDFVMDFNADSFAIIKSFRNLEVLSMSQIYGIDDYFSESWFAGGTVFPPTLKSIKSRKIFISCSTFFSIVKQLPFHVQFDLGIGTIFWDHFECKFLY